MAARTGGRTGNMAFKRIALAYCVQLDRVISIASARREYFSQAEPRKPLRLPLLQRSVPGTGDQGIGEQLRQAAAGYPQGRALQQVPAFHPPAGLRVVVEDDEDALRPGESAEEAGQRRIRDKLDAYVEEFDPAIARKPRRHQRTRTPRNSRRPPPQCVPTLPLHLGRERNGGGAPAISNSSSTPSARPAPNCRRKNSSSWTSTSAASAG
ncbi:Uncharacterised protein [Pseudomonas aeruginosa]|nr:Uncharacterised protein [Pseudomonas aeruginosa]